MYQIVLKAYEGSHPIKEVYQRLDMEKEVQEYSFEEVPCKVTVTKKADREGVNFDITAEALKEVETPVSVSLELVEEAWKKTEYVFMPGAVYNGNRQESKYIAYPPYYAGKKDGEWNQVITDIPHLDVEGKESAIQFLSGDMTTPAMGYFNKEEKEGLLMFAKHMENGRYTGFTVHEKENEAVFRVSCPGVREDKKYFFGDLPDGSGFYPTCNYPSDDEGIILKEGETLHLEVKVFKMRTESMHEYFSGFNRVREVFETGDDFVSVPFSKAYETIKEKYLKMNFTEEGYYRVGTENTAAPSFWQSGWTGGGMNTYSFLMEDKGDACSQAESTLRFIVKNLQEETGWYVPMYANGVKYGDDFGNVDSPVVLVRKDADLLYFLLKQAVYLKKHNRQIEGLDESIEKQADAFVRFVGKNGEIGQFVDSRKEELLGGGTASAAIVCGALASAYEYFGKEEYLEIAETLADSYWEKYLRKGFVNGGPGEICQAPDSESAFALLESYVQLYETTGKEKWLKAAEEAFELAITWVVSYDFIFPKDTAAVKIDAHTRGTVFANAQNKHSAPGICTFSGNSLLKLYRFTGDGKYLEWLRRISHALAQFVSLPERPVDTLSNKPLIPGYINERVQTSDWEGKHTVGGFLYGSNWPEVTMLLTYVEVPGVYVDLDREMVMCNDHVSAELVKDGNCLKICNTTSYDAVVTIMAEHSKSAEVLGHSYFENMRKVEVQSGEETVITL